MTRMLPVLLPFFVILSIGITAGFSRRFEAAEPAINAFVYYIAMPAFLCTTIADTDPQQGFPPSFLLATLGPALLVAVCSYCISALVPGATHNSALPFSLAAAYGNVGYLGVPIVLALLGPSGALAAAFGQLLHNLMFMVGYPIVSLGVSQHNGKSHPQLRLLSILSAAAFRNPVTLSVIAGLVIAFAHIKLSGFVGTSLTMLGQVAIPGALFAIGLTLRGALAQMRNGGISPFAVIAASTVKLAVLPGTTLLLVALLASFLPQPWAQTAVIMAATPVSATAFVLCEEYNGGEHFMASVIAITTIASVFTMPLFIGFSIR